MQEKLINCISFYNCELFEIVTLHDSLCIYSHPSCETYLKSIDKHNYKMKLKYSLQ